MSSPMEYGASEDAAPEYDGAGDSALGYGGRPEYGTPEYGGADGGAHEYGGGAEYDGAQALASYSENVPGEGDGYGREWHYEPLTQVAADAFGHVAQDAERAAGNVLGDIAARSDFS